MLVVDGVQFAYRGSPILRGLGMKVGNGDLVGIVGPNGTGKTTLLRLVTGVLSPQSGKILVDGADLTTLSTKQRARLVSIVPQDPQLPLSYTVLDLVLMGRNPHLKLLQWEGRRDLEIAIHAMEMTGIDHLAGRAIGTLSGGERQRAVVAMALAQEAPVMLLDEPTSSLDLSHQSRVMDLIRKAQRERGGSVLVAMHDLNLAAQYCDRLVMLSNGRCYVDGTPGDVLSAEHIYHVYGVRVSVLSHPVTGVPVVVPLPDGLPASPALRDYGLSPSPGTAG